MPNKVDDLSGRPSEDSITNRHCDRSVLASIISHILRRPYVRLLQLGDYYFILATMISDKLPSIDTERCYMQDMITALRLAFCLSCNKNTIIERGCMNRVFENNTQLAIYLVCGGRNPYRSNYTTYVQLIKQLNKDVTSCN